MAIARRRLEPQGVEVVDVTSAPNTLPVPDASIDAVLNRHEDYDAAEVARVLRPGGTYVTQQVGGRDLQDLNEVLGAPAHPYAGHDLAGGIDDAERHGLAVVDSAEEYVPTTFVDIGAVVLYLRIVSWQIPDFSLATYDAELRALHERIVAGDGFDARAHRFYLVAQKA